MLSYNAFKEKLVADIKGYLPVKYKHYTVQVNTINKTNMSMDGLCLIESKKHIAASPVVYIDMLYTHYLRYGNLSDTITLAADTIKKGFNCIQSNIDAIPSKDNIVFTLINYERNQKLLKDVPHTRFLDLAFVYRWIVGLDDSGMSSGIITNELAKAFDLDTDKLFELAKENTRRLLPPKVTHLTDTLKHLLPQELHSVFSMPVYILTNQISVLGATSVIYNDILDKLKKELNDNLYVIPSSINEVLIVPQRFVPENNIKAMVKEVNITSVAENEQLSDNVYIYDGSIRLLQPNR